MRIKYRGVEYVNFIVHYQDGEVLKVELFKQGDHLSAQPRHSIHTSREKVEFIFNK
jgi:hypothetical protein